MDRETPIANMTLCSLPTAQQLQQRQQKAHVLSTYNTPHYQNNYFDPETSSLLWELKLREPPGQ